MSIINTQVADNNQTTYTVDEVVSSHHGSRTRGECWRGGGLERVSSVLESRRRLYYSFIKYARRFCTKIFEKKKKIILFEICFL